MRLSAGAPAVGGAAPSGAPCSVCQIRQRRGVDGGKEVAAMIAPVPVNVPKIVVLLLRLLLRK